MNFGFWRRIAPLLVTLAIIAIFVGGCSWASAASPPPKTNSDGSITYYLKADDMKFDTDRMTMPAGAKVTIVFNNADSFLHNVSLRAARFDPVAIFRGETIGKKTIEYTFTTPSQPGTYIFQCDLHPDMYGEFIVT